MFSSLGISSPDIMYIHIWLYVLSLLFFEKKKKTTTNFSRYGVRSHTTDIIFIFILCIFLCDLFSAACIFRLYFSPLDAHCTCSNSHHGRRVCVLRKSMIHITKADINCNWYFFILFQHLVFSSVCVFFELDFIFSFHSLCLCRIWLKRFSCCLSFVCVFSFCFCSLILMLKYFILIAFYDVDHCFSRASLVPLWTNKIVQ